MSYTLIAHVFGLMTVPCGRSFVYVGLTAVSLWILTMNNDDYNISIEFRGRKYWYDPERDIFYPRSDELSNWDRWGWLLVIVCLAGLAWALSTGAAIGPVI